MNCIHASPASDMWSLGATTFQLLSGGVAPFWAGGDNNPLALKDSKELLHQKPTPNSTQNHLMCLTLFFINSHANISGSKYRTMARTINCQFDFSSPNFQLVSPDAIDFIRKVLPFHSHKLAISRMNFFELSLLPFSAIYSKPI